MARKAIMVGINDYKGIPDLTGCINDVLNIRHILKTCLGFTNSDIHVLFDRRAIRQTILSRLDHMVDQARPGDFMVFYFSGHGSQIRDRDGDELSDGMDELLCPWDMDWNGTYILDDDLDRIFCRIPDGAMLEVFLDCCHSGAVSDAGRSAGAGPSGMVRAYPVPLDIALRAEGEEEEVMGNLRGFRSVNRSGVRSTRNHILWAGCREGQRSREYERNGVTQGAFSYFLGRHLRETGGNITRRILLERIRASLRQAGFDQVPQLLTAADAVLDQPPLQFPSRENPVRMLYLTTPYMRGNDVKRLQKALARKGYAISTDGVFGPHTRQTVCRFQRDHGLSMADGVARQEVYDLLF